MIRIKAYILPLILICLCGCSLIGCLSIAVESEKAEETEMTFTRDGKKIYGKLYTPKGADHGFGGADDERATGLGVDFVKLNLFVPPS